MHKDFKFVPRFTNLYTTREKMSKENFFKSSIGQKVIMALTGLFLCTFLIVHLIGNFQLFKADDGMAFNVYAVFMTSNPLIKTTSYLLYAAILYHAFKGFALTIQNRKARPVQYAAFNNPSSWSSRNMAMLGTVILVFIVIHMQNFWFEYKFGYTPWVKYTTNVLTGETKSEDVSEAMRDAKFKKQEYTDKDEMGNTYNVVITKDLYKKVAVEFKEEMWLVILYIIAMGALSFHLVHGFKSGFQSLGLNHKRYNPIINAIGVWGFGILIPIGFAAMPIYLAFMK